MATSTIQLESLLKLSKEKSFDKEFCKKTFEAMMMTRLLDEKMMKLVRQNKGGTFHLNTMGHELIGVMSGLSLQAGKDWAFPYYRDRAFAVGLGCSPKDMIGAFLARDIGNHSSGRMMPEHFSQKDLRIPCQSSVVGSQFLQAVGVAASSKLRDTDEVVYVSGGDGSTSQGDFHEALNFACIHKLPVIFVIQDNGWAISVPVKDQTAGGSIAKLASGYEGLSIYDIDGCDYHECQVALEDAIKKGRGGIGPSLVVAKIPRIGPHSSSDNQAKYKSEKNLQDEKDKDPIPRMEAFLQEKEILTLDEITSIKERIKQEIDEATVEADKVPFPDPDTILDHVFKDAVVEEKNDDLQGETVVMVDALNHAIDEEMARDDKVIVFGQDVAFGKGGVFGITAGLTDKYGKRRCFNTPLAESTIVGLSIGLSMSGFIPVAEIQFADYMWTSVNQIVNELSSIHYRSNGVWNCPVVLRMPYGGYIQGGPYHSQSVEAYLCHTPGIKVVIPSNASDAKRLLKAAIRDPNPVIFLEHKGLYRQRVYCASKEPSEDSILPLGKANIVKEGTDVTLISWGMMAYMGSEVADKLSKEGISIEVIDLRTLNPLDMDTILTSVQKTGKCLIAHEAALFGGFGAEVAASIAKDGFEYLDAPIERLGGENCPVSYCKVLEDRGLPQRDDLYKRLKALSEY